MPKVDVKIMGEVDVQIKKKRKTLIDQIRFMSDVWKRNECADFGVRPWKKRERRDGANGDQKRMTIFSTERLESSGRERSPDQSSQTDFRADGPGASETQTGQMETQSGETPRIVQNSVVTTL